MRSIIDQAKCIVELAEKATPGMIGWQYDKSNCRNSVWVESPTAKDIALLAECRLNAPEIAQAFLRCVEVLAWYGDEDRWKWLGHVLDINHPNTCVGRKLDGDQGRRARDLLKELSGDTK